MDTMMDKITKSNKLGQSLLWWLFRSFKQRVVCLLKHAKSVLVASDIVF